MSLELEEWHRQFDDDLFAIKRAMVFLCCGATFALYCLLMVIMPPHNAEGVRYQLLSPVQQLVGLALGIAIAIAAQIRIKMLDYRIGSLQEKIALVEPSI